MKWSNVANRGQNAIFRDAEFSPAEGSSIWELAPILAMLMDPAVGFHFFEDFLFLACDDTTRNPSAVKWVSDTATDGITLPKLAGGVINVQAGGVDENETYIQWGQPAGLVCAPFGITDASGKPLFFEARVKAVELTQFGIFVGLAEEGAAVANFLVDATGAIVDKDYIGFRLCVATPLAWDFVWRKNGEVGQVRFAVAVNGGDWHTLSFWFDGLHTVTPYANGVAKTANPTSGVTFPSAQLMSPIIAIKTTEAVTKGVQVDYIRVIQAR